MDYSFLVYLDEFVAGVTLLLVVFNLMYFKKPSSVGFTSLAFVMIQALSVVLTPFLIGPVSEHSRDLGRMMFYFSFAFLDLLAVVLISNLHKQYELSITKFSNFVVRALQFLAVLQVLRYLDRTFGADIGGTIYQFAVPVTNIAIVMILIFATYREFIQVRGISGLKGV